MGQKDQDGYYAKKVSLFHNFGPDIHKFKNRSGQKKTI